jgi:hypothetical protein
VTDHVCSRIRVRKTLCATFIHSDKSNHQINQMFRNSIVGSTLPVSSYSSSIPSSIGYSSSYQYGTPFPSTGLGIGNTGLGLGGYGSSYQYGNPIQSTGLGLGRSGLGIGSTGFDSGYGTTFTTPKRRFGSNFSVGKFRSESEIIR